jgi:hypothetical protein
MSYALLAVFILLVLAYCFLMWKSRDLLRWYAITAGIVSLILAIVFLLPTAAVLKSRSSWHKVKEDLEAQLARLQSEQESLKNGDPATGGGADQLQENFNRFALEAGRRWDGLRMQANNPAGITLERVAPAAELPPGMAAEDPAATPDPNAAAAANPNDPAAAAAAGAATPGTPAAPAVPAAPGTPPAPGTPVPPGTPAAAPPAGVATTPAGAPGAAPAAAPLPLIPVGLVVYGFAETVTPLLPTAVPTFYLGEFRVKSSSPTQVVLEPTGRLEGPQLQAITSGNAQNWSLYELLPLDSHDVFIAAGSEPADDAIFGRPDDNMLRQLMGQSITEPTMNKYLRDGGRAQQDDPPPSRWTKIEFTQAHKIAVDSPEQRGALDGGFFDGSGQAVDSRLQRGGDDGSVAFNPGDQLILKEEAASALIEGGVAKLVDNYYVRPLNDYRLVLRRLRLRLEELAIRKSQLEIEQKVLDDAIAATVKMLASNQESKLKLEKDLAQIQVERSAIDKYNATVKEQLTNTRSTLSGLYRENLGIRQQLDEISRGIEASLPR